MNQVDLQPGLKLGHYVVLSGLGQGGMGQVFLADDTTLGRQVALKVLPRELIGDCEHLERFRREARNLAALNHPNIVTVFSVEEIEGVCVLVMEYVDGETLRHLVVPGGAPIERVLAIAYALSDAVASAHERGVMHRDLKPENVMVSKSGRVKVLDFGLAKAHISSTLQSPSSSSLTHTGVLLGTVPYMSPEQIDGRSMDHRSDIFSIGVILHELLTGQRPFTGETAARTLSSILRDEPLPISSVRQDTPPALEGIVRLCLQKDPSQRFQTAAQVRDQLYDLLHTFRSERSDSAARRRVLSGPFSLPQVLPHITSLRTRTGLTALLAAIFAVNWAETATETALRANYGIGESLGYDIAAVMSWAERGLTFERHDLTNPLGIYLASMAYFALPVVLGLMTAWRLARMPSVTPYRAFVFATTIAYGISFVCYVFFPVPERWAYPDSEAVLLSDLWTTTLIDTLRPISGLDNCFPSFHVSITVVMVLLSYVYRLRYRTAFAFASAAVIVSTFMLGIHWLPDIIAGFALGLVSVRLALAWNPAESHSDPFKPVAVLSTPRPL